jgi:pimeloyl-ACP methyl ester carboxylesterase
MSTADGKPQPAHLQRHDGETMACYRSAGRSPGVIFLGGCMSDMSGIKATTLEHWCRTQGQAFVRFDYLGHGESSGSFEQGTIGRWSEDAIAVVDQLSEGPQILVGSSMGGWIMLLTALARPGRIAGLLGIAAAPDFTERLLTVKLNEAERKQLQSAGVVYQPSAYSDKPYAITRLLIEEGNQHLLLQADIPLSCPVRLLHAMNDVDVPWQNSLKLAEQLSSDDVRLILLKDGEHRLSREQDLQILISTLAELIDASQSAVC